MTDDASAPSIGGPVRQTGSRRLLSERLSRLNQVLEERFDLERDQLALWLPVGLGAGIASWFWLPDGAAWRAFLLGAAAAMLLCLALAPRSRWARALSIVSLAAFVGCALIWWRAEQATAPRLEFSRMAAFEGVVERVQPLPARQMTRLVVRPNDASGLPGRVRINVADRDWQPEISAGATVRLRAWLMPPASMAVPGAYDFARHAWFARIGGSGRALELDLVEPRPGAGWRQQLDEWRQSVANRIQQRLDAGPAGIATALATGDQGAISEADAEAMRRSGLAHLLSVSGLHLTAVVGAVMVLTLKLLALSPALALRFPLMLIAAAAAGLAGIAYTLFTGAEVPTVRACIAALLVLAAIALGREALTLRLVAVGALIVLLLWPETLVGPSFQLSFAAITAIVALHDHPRVKALLSRRDEGLLQKAGRVALGLLLTGLVVEIALMPIALYHFHKAGLYGALANVLAIPLTTFVVMPLEVLALVLDLAGAGAPAWWLANATLGLLLRIAHVTAEAPGAVAMLGEMPPAAFALIAVGGLWLALWRSGWRRWGLLPILVGGAWTLSIPKPDLIVTGDGRHLALRGEDGRYALLRPRAGDYIRDVLAETAGSDAEPGSIEDLPSARCSRDLCFAELYRHGRKWRLLATRSPHLVPWRELVSACRSVDVAVSDRRLPKDCVPRWLKADRTFLRRSGGFAVSFAESPRVSTVADRVGRHPWAVAAR